MVNSGKKLIFVLLPGVKEHLKQHIKTDSTYVMITRALEVRMFKTFNNFTKINVTYMYSIVRHIFNEATWKKRLNHPLHEGFYHSCSHLLIANFNWSLM